jgi:Ran GTPase-activating protein (RanGAP) involved in mRNA processing and transport
LNLSNNALGDDAVIAISGTMTMGNFCIEHLDLSKNFLTDKCGARLGYEIGLCRALTILDLHDNEFTGVTGNHLLIALAVNKTMKQFLLHEN